MGQPGRKIVLAATPSESSEHKQKPWSQMLLATLPLKYVRAFNVHWPRSNELGPDGQAKYVPHGLRIVESLLLQNSLPRTSRFVKPTNSACLWGTKPAWLAFTPIIPGALRLPPTFTPIFTAETPNPSTPRSFVG